MEEDETRLSKDEKQAIDAIGSELEREFSVPSEVRGRHKSSLYVPIAFGGVALVTVLMAIIIFFDRAIDGKIATTEGPLNLVVAPPRPIREEQVPSPGEMNAGRVDLRESRRLATTSDTTGAPSGAGRSRAAVSSSPALSGGTRTPHSGSASALKAPCVGHAPPATSLAEATGHSRSNQGGVRTGAAAEVRRESIAPVLTTVSTREPRLIQAP